MRIDVPAEHEPLAAFFDLDLSGSRLIVSQFFGSINEP